MAGEAIVVHRTQNPPPTAAELQQLKRQLLKKGAEINEKLTRLLNHQTVDVGELLGGGQPGETPIERLRRFMAIIDARLVAIREGRYGICEQCGDGLPFSHLEQIPWLDTCQRCAAPPI
jgi:RNA polymerase-binding transcription factor DksA